MIWSVFTQTQQSGLLISSAIGINIGLKLMLRSANCCAWQSEIICTRQNVHCTCRLKLVCCCFIFFFTQRKNLLDVLIWVLDLSSELPADWRHRSPALCAWDEPLHPLESWAENQKRQQLVRQTVITGWELGYLKCDSLSILGCWWGSGRARARHLGNSSD